MINILTIKREYWVTCPYSEYLLKDTFKIVYICALPLVFYLIFLTKISSLLMQILVFTFNTIIDLGTNLTYCLEEMGAILNIIVGLNIEEDSLDDDESPSKMELMIRCFEKVNWVGVLGWKSKERTSVYIEEEEVLKKVECVSIISTY